MKHLRQLSLIALTSVAVFVGGCSSLGLPTAKTFNERLAVGYGTVTAVRNTAATMLVAREITPQDARQVQQHADMARSGLNVAADLQLTDVPAAEQRLSTSLQILKGLQDYLATKGKK